MSMMTQTKVAVSSNTFSDNEILRKNLVTHFPNAYFNSTGRILAGAELAEFLEDGTAAIMGLEKIDAAVLGASPRLEVISKFGVGMDNVDLTYCAQRGIKVLSSPGVNALAAAELAFALMFAIARRIAISTHHLKTGRWLRNGGVQVVGKKVGVIGLGNVGKQTAQLAQSVGCSVMAHDILDMREYCAARPIEFCSLDQVLRDSDFLSIHVPLTKETKSMIGRDQLQKMKPTAFLINTARGGIVDEDALANALEQETIAGAAFDVFAEEPTSNTRLLGFDNFIGTPHVGGNSREAIQAVGMAAIHNLLGYFSSPR